MEKKYLIIPDVHGRAFWREPVFDTLKNSDVHIVFLGDYLDPYPHEWKENVDYKGTAIERFKDIIDFKKDNPDRITLLLGNHDASYAIGPDICDCRRDKRHYREIEKLFDDNRNLFTLIKEVDVNGKHFVFSHAGVLRGFLSKYFNEEEIKNFAEMYNTAWKEDQMGVLNTLGDYDNYRGWMGGSYGSFLWSDIRSWVHLKENDTFGFNIVGHTMCEKPIMLDTIVNLDCQQVFYLDDEGKIRFYADDKEVEKYKL